MNSQLEREDFLLGPAAKRFGKQGLLARVMPFRRNSAASFENLSTDLIVWLISGSPIVYSSPQGLPSAMSTIAQPWLISKYAFGDTFRAQHLLLVITVSLMLSNA